MIATQCSILGDRGTRNLFSLLSLVVLFDFFKDCILIKKQKLKKTLKYFLETLTEAEIGLFVKNRYY